MVHSTITDLKPEIDDSVDEIPTPSLVIDLDVMESNIKDYADWAEAHDVQLRSHAKTHKIPDIAHYQNRITNQGGIVCQTLSEAEVMIYNGHTDVFISYILVDKKKINRFVRLSEKVDHLSTTVDGTENVDRHQSVAARNGTSIDVVLELDVGYNRTGVKLGEPAVDLAEYIHNQPNLNLIGVLAYEAHIRGVDTEREMEKKCNEVMDETAETVDMIEDSVVQIREVKAGGTSTSQYSGKHPVVTEINPGLYPFNDVREMGHRPWAINKDDMALTVVTTIISSPEKNRRIVDAGSKSIAVATDPDPMPKGDNNVEFYTTSEEHGWIDVSECDTDLRVGDTLEFIPPHTCPTINLHNTVVGVRNGQVRDVWEVSARGKVK